MTNSGSTPSSPSSSSSAASVTTPPSPSAPPLPDDEMSVMAGTGPEPKKPEPKKKEDEEIYINLYPVEGNYGTNWNALFVARAKDPDGEQFEAKLYSPQEVAKLDKGVAHKALHDCEFTVKKWKGSASENAVIRAFAADVTSAAFAALKEPEAQKESEEQKAAREKKTKTKQAVVLCCMVDQIIAHMLTSGVKKENIELELAGDPELVQAASIYAAINHGIDPASIKCLDNSGKEYPQDKVKRVQDQEEFKRLITGPEKEKFAVTESALRAMLSSVKVQMKDESATKEINNLEDIERRFDSSANSDAAAEFKKNIIKNPNWLAGGATGPAPGAPLAPAATPQPPPSAPPAPGGRT